MRSSFVNEAFVLMVAAAFNRAVGFVYQAVIFRIIGAEGVGLFNLVYPVYIMIVVLATGGIPLGISKIVSEEDAAGNLRGSYQLFWLALGLLTVSGTAFAITACAVSPWLQQHVLANPRAYPVFLCMVPGILVISVSSGFRGFFQGLMQMRTPALGQVTEQLVRVCAGVYLAEILLPLGLEWAAGGLALAGIAGELAGLIVMSVIFLKQKPAYIHPRLPDILTTAGFLRRLFRMCTPITIGRLAATVMLAVDAVIIPALLTRSGYPVAEATAMYGQFTGVALSLLFVPSIITVSLSTSLVPAVSAAMAQNRSSLVSSRVSEAVRVTVISGMPFIAAYTVIPAEIAQAVYGAPEGGRILGIMAVCGLMAYLQQTTTGILQGLGRPAVPLANMLIGGIGKVVAMITLTRIPGLGIRGVAYAYNLFFAVTAVLNLICLQRSVRLRWRPVHVLVKPVAAGFAGAATCGWAYRWGKHMAGSNAKGVMIALLAGFAAYFAAAFGLGAVTADDCRRIPVIGRFMCRERRPPGR